ncbi:putative all-trans-nonaprenyl-diphosphate synthase (geranyl-diphosphate specific) [Helianthus anomalus]
MMTPATCHNLEFGRIKFADFVACGCSFNASFDWLICCRGDEKVAKCRVDAPGPPPVLSVKKESTADLFEVVSDDLLTLNKNLQSIVGAKNMVLMSAAEQIFSAGGERMRPALVFY